MIFEWDEGYMENLDKDCKKWKSYKETNMKNGCYLSTRYDNVKLYVNGRHYNTNDVEIVSDYIGTTITATARMYPPDLTPLNKLTSTPNINTPSITNVIFNPPATIVFWSDKTKTVVKCDYEYEIYDPEKGIAMAIAKKLIGDNQSKYYNAFRPWIEKYNEQQKEEEEDVDGEEED